MGAGLLVRSRQQLLAPALLNLFLDRLRGAIQDLPLPPVLQDARLLFKVSVLQLLSRCLHLYLLLDTHRQVVQQVASSLRLVLLELDRLLWSQTSPDAQRNVVQQLLPSLLVQVLSDAYWNVIQCCSARLRSRVVPQSMGRKAFQDLRLQKLLYTWDQHSLVQHISEKFRGEAYAVSHRWL